MRKKFWFALALLVMVVCLPLCATTLEEKFVGTWECELIQVEFLDDNTCILKTIFGTRELAIWKALDSKTAIIVEHNGGVCKVILKNDDILSIADLGGDVFLCLKTSN